MVTLKQDSFFLRTKTVSNPDFSSYGVLEEFASVLDQLWAVFYYLPILTTTKWTMDLGQQQNGTKLAYISNGVDKQQKLPKRGPKNTCMVPQKTVSMKQLKILEKSYHTVFFFIFML